jgi:hypothetical protein
MKKLFVLLFILTVTVSVNVSAWGQSKRDSTPKLYINKKGGIVDQKGTKLGYIDKDNIVRNAEGAKLYFIDKDGNVIGADGKKLGIAKKNGSYYNINGENVLNTKDLDKERCAVLDPQGHNVGIIHKNYKLHACVIHCYWLEQARLKKEKEEKAKAN